MGIATLLMACEGNSYEFPHFGTETTQGGAIVRNGQGECLLNAELQGNGWTQLFAALGCSNKIVGNSMMGWRKLGHYNGHIDLSAMFIGPRVVMIPKANKGCETPYLEEWSKLKTSLTKNDLKVIEVPIAGCPFKSKEAKDGEPGSKLVRTYSNGDVLSNAVLIPEFAGFDGDNMNARQVLEQAMKDGMIPKKRIVSIPSPEGGGEVRCMSLEVPGQIGKCTQARLDKAVQGQIDEAHAVAESANCPLVQAKLDAIRFLYGEPQRRRSMVTPDGLKISIAATLSSRLEAVAGKLENAQAKCSSQ